LSPDDDTPEPDAGPPEHLSGTAGMDLVRRVLEEARGNARTQGKDVGRGRRLPPTRRVAGSGSRRRWSGPGPDNRDPQPLASATRDVSKKQGWSARVAEGAVFGQWPTVVGHHIAVSAESTAWATQLRIIQSRVLAKIAAEVGDGVVTSLKITGPVAPSWRKGSLHIAGRGPRDTYG
jgi:predicted nucleic acid-binding Zn ribbon protein